MVVSCANALERDWDVAVDPGLSVGHKDSSTSFLPGSIWLLSVCTVLSEELSDFLGPFSVLGLLVSVYPCFLSLSPPFPILFEQIFAVFLGLTWNLLCGLGWSQLHSWPAFTPRVLELEVCLASRRSFRAAQMHPAPFMLFHVLVFSCIHNVSCSLCTVYIRLLF